MSKFYIGMHDDPNYSVRLSKYKEKLQSRAMGVPFMDEYEIKQREEERKMFGLPGTMLATDNEERKRSGSR